MNALPDPDDDPATHGHFNTGDLSPLPPTNVDYEGDLPKDLLRATPPSPGNYPLDNPAELAHPKNPKYQQPVAVSLNEADVD